MRAPSVDVYNAPTLWDRRSLTPELVDGLAYFAVFLFSTTIHEASHAWMAKRGGDLTAYHGGQVSLDPVPHIKREPIGMVVLPLISVVISGWPLGFASAPYHPVWARTYPRRAALMALAGPTSNLLIVIVAAGLLRAASLSMYSMFPIAHTSDTSQWQIPAASGLALPTCSACCSR